jgi:DNA-binding NarL/FixJ family response regulator
MGTLAMQKQYGRNNLLFEAQKRSEAGITRQELIKVRILSKHALAVRIVTHIIDSNPLLREIVALESSFPSQDEAVAGEFCLLVLDTCSIAEWPDLLMRHLSSSGRAVVLLPEELASRIHRCELFYSGICAIIAISADFASELPRAILSVAQGAIWTSKTVTQSALGNRAQPRLQKKHEVLTAREEQIVTILRQGLGNRQVGTILGISERTVKFHVSNIMQKLQVRGRLELLHTVPQECNGYRRCS